jgi:hypothetical protein
MSVTDRGFTSPDDTTTFDKGRIEVINLGDVTIRRSTFEPGWRWSECVKPIAKTDSCQVHHVGYVLSGTLHIATEDGGEAEIVAGTAYDIGPGHDGWVIGDQTAMTVEFSPAQR